MNEEEIAKLRGAYKKIVFNKASLTSVSLELGIERKRLKKLIEQILSEEEKQKFEEVLSNNSKKGKNTGRKGRDKKKKALEGDEYKEAIRKLAMNGITPKIIEDIYLKCQQKKQSKISRDTLAIKLVKYLEYFESRNSGIRPEEEAYISANDVVDMILRNPRMITSDLNNTIINIFTKLDEKSGNTRETNKDLKRNPVKFNMKNMLEQGGK